MKARHFEPSKRELTKSVFCLDVLLMPSVFTRPLPVNYPSITRQLSHLPIVFHDVRSRASCSPKLQNSSAKMGASCKGFQIMVRDTGWDEKTPQDVPQ